MSILSPSLRGAKRRNNPELAARLCEEAYFADEAIPNSFLILRLWPVFTAQPAVGIVKAAVHSFQVSPFVGFEFYGF
jgi:hypothetical protein